MESLRPIPLRDAQTLRKERIQTTIIPRIRELFPIVCNGLVQIRMRNGAPAKIGIRKDKSYIDRPVKQTRTYLVQFVDRISVVLKETAEILVTMDTGLVQIIIEEALPIEIRVLYEENFGWDGACSKTFHEVPLKKT